MNNPFKKKVEKIVVPYRRGVVRYSSAAMKGGVFHDFLKQIVILEGNVEKEVYPYTVDVFESFSESIPFVDETLSVVLEEAGVDSVDDASELNWELPSDD